MPRFIDLPGDTRPDGAADDASRQPQLRQTVTAAPDRNRPPRYHPESRTHEESMNEWDIGEVDWPVCPAAAAEVLADGDELAWLDSSADVATDLHGAGFSMLCARPYHVARTARRAAGDADMRPISRSTGTPTGGGSGGRALDRFRVGRLSPWRLSPGWVGYVGFEMARYLERLPCSHREDTGPATDASGIVRPRDRAGSSASASVRGAGSGRGA